MAIELPDFDVMMEDIDNIYNKSREKALLDVRLKQAEAELTRAAQVDPKYFKDGKPPAQNFVDNAYKYTGLNNELVEPRNLSAMLGAEVEMLKNKLELKHKIIDIWRTQAANERILTS